MRTIEEVKNYLIELKSDINKENIELKKYNFDENYQLAEENNIRISLIEKILKDI